MQIFRCSACNKVLYEAEIIKGTIKKKCKCGCMNVHTFSPDTRTFAEKLHLVRK
jgi:phage FluMu protein Com